MELISGIRNVPLFSRGDFFDLDILAAKLKKPADPVSQFINTHLSENSLHLLNTYDRSELQRNELAKALVTEFNRLVFSTDLYNTELFKHVNLTEKTRTLLDQHPKGRLLMSLNRMLLEDAYPVEIVRTPFSNLSAEDLAVHRMSLMVEASTRLALSFSCFAFVLLGASLGMKMHRKESSAGIAITLLLVFVFYFFIIIADSLVSHPELQPHLIVWIPFLAAEGLGFYLLYRSN